MKLCPRCDEAYPDEAAFCPFDASALVRSTDPLLGRTLAARYRLIRKIGSGGMALVYLARQVMIDRRSAIKILRQDFGVNPAHRERFLREARAVNRINHPNIVEITDFGEDGPLVFLVMEYIEGESLLDAIGRGPMSSEQAIHIGLQVTSALARAHELGVIHRDLKPENVLLRRSPPAGDSAARPHDAYAVKLTDFGIAKIVDAPTLTYSDQRFGTPGYIAPEYIDGATASPLGDLYALGVLFYEMLTGTLPFDAAYPADMLVQQLQGTPVPLRNRVPGISLPLEELVLRLIARRPEDRPRDAFAVLDALRQVLAGLDDAAPASEPPDSEPSPATVRFQAQTPPTVEPVADGPASGEVPARWRASLADLEARLENARHARGDRDPQVRRARDLLTVALELHESLERAGTVAEGHQGTVDRLEAAGREFRETLGRAIDTLSHDRSRERARLEVLAGRRRQLSATLSAPGQASEVIESLRREDAMIQWQEQSRRSIEADLAFQLETLQRQLHAKNEELEDQLRGATGGLEGALSAVRRITREIAHTREEAIGLLA